MGTNQHVRRLLGPALAALGRQRPCIGTEAAPITWAAAASVAGPSTSSGDGQSSQQGCSPHQNLRHGSLCHGAPPRGFHSGFGAAISCRHHTTQPSTFAATAGGRRIPSWTQRCQTGERRLATGQEHRSTDAAGVPPAPRGGPKGQEEDVEAIVISSSAEDAQIWTAAATRAAALPPLNPQRLFKVLFESCIASVAPLRCPATPSIRAHGNR